MVGLTLLAALWLRYSALGRAFYALGGNPEAARLSGFSQTRLTVQVFVLNGVFAGIAAVLYATQLNVIQPTPPPNLELFVITSAVVGGVSILGGTGTVIGAMLARSLLKHHPLGDDLRQRLPFWIQAVQGVLILATVLVDLVRRRRQWCALARAQPLRPALGQRVRALLLSQEGHSFPLLVSSSWCCARRATLFSRAATCSTRGR
jgi:ribose transport system permease protein/rhamnose transport system permease protein